MGSGRIDHLVTISPLKADSFLIDADMGVGIDDAWHDNFALGINDFSAGGNLQIGAYGLNLAGFYEYGPLFQDRAGHGVNLAVYNCAHVHTPSCQWYDICIRERRQKFL